MLHTLGQKIPDAAGGVGTVVFRSEAGSFTPAQQAAITRVLGRWAELPHVKKVQDPFTNQKGIDEGATQLADAKKQLDASAVQLKDGRAQLDAAQSQLAFGRTALADLKKTNPADPQIPVLERQLADGASQLAEQEKAYAAGKADYDAGLTAYTQGVARTKMLDGMRFVSTDGRYAVAQIQFDTDVHSVPQAIRDEIPAIGASLTASGVQPDYSVEITQDTKLIGPGEVIGLVVAALVLVIMLGTLIAAGLPLTVALFGVGIGLAGAMTATVFYDMNTMTPSLALMLGLAVGIDYALFIVNRHRGQLLRGMELARVDRPGRRHRRQRRDLRRGDRRHRAGRPRRQRHPHPRPDGSGRCGDRGHHRPRRGDHQPGHPQPAQEQGGVPPHVAVRRVCRRRGPLVAGRSTAARGGARRLVRRPRRPAAPG